MLSQYSGFTDAGEEFVFPEAPRQPAYSWPTQPPANAGATNVVFAEDRKESESSGSGTTGSTASNSPRPQAKPFVPAANKAVGTIGPPGKGQDRAPQSPPGAIGSGR